MFVRLSPLSLLVVAWAWLALAITSALGREWNDTSGKFRVEAELVAVRNGKVILEKADGSVITVALDKLSAADLEFLKARDNPPPAAAPKSDPAKPAAPATGNPAPKALTPVAPLAATPIPAAPAPVTAEGAALAEKAKAVFQANCYRCHGEDGASEGGFNFVLNLEKLARTVVKPKNLSGSLLYERMTSSGDSVMPPEGEKPRPSAADLATVKAWIEAGAPALPAAKPREFISNEAMLKYILADVQKASERSRRFLRYFTLTHLYNAGVSDDELQTYRNAFNKLLNSLSWSKDLIIPEAIDAAKTVFRIDIRVPNWSNEQWEQIEGANPYFLTLTSPDAVACNEATQARMPYVRIDWFVFAASKPPLYHAVLSAPGTDKDLEAMLHVNVEANIAQEKALRAAFNRSGVSQNNRLIEWHSSSYGSYWKSYDFGGSAGRQNLFQYPLGPGGGQDSFQHDGGELIFTLPNGMQGYLLVNGSGQRIDQGPTSIVSDPKQPDRTVTNGVSCMSCHYTGVISKADEVGVAVRANPKAFQNSADILAIYREPEHLNRVLEADGKRFAGALRQIGITSLSRSGEPISAMAMRFQQELDLPMAACEFGLSPEEFLKRLDGAETTARVFSPLRIPGGTIKRDVYVSCFSEACREFHVVGDARPVTATTKTGSNTPLTALPASPGLAALAKLPATDGNKPGEVRRFHDIGWGIDSLAFSPSGGFLAAGKMDRAVLMFDVAKGERLESKEKLEVLGQVKACAFTPSGTQLLTAGYSGHIIVWDVSRDGRLKETGQFAGHSKEIKCLAVSADGKFALSGGDEKKLRYWEIATGREQAVFADFGRSVVACQFVKGSRTALATDGKLLLTIDLTKREVTRKRDLGRISGEAAAFTPDGGFLAVADGYKIHVWNMSSTGEMPPLEDNETQWTVAFTPDGTRLLAGARGKVNVWDFRKQRKIFAQTTAGSGYIQCLAPSPDNKHLAAIPSSAGQDLQIFRLPNVDK